MERELTRPEALLLLSRSNGDSASGAYVRNRSDVLPPDLQRLLEPSDDAEREAAWDALVGRHSRLLIHVARLVMKSHDDAMDAYAHLLERIRRDDFKALRIYAADGRSQFSTWLAVVARRTCVDFYRHKYGRPRGETQDFRHKVEQVARLRLAHFVASPAELTEIPDSHNGTPDSRIRIAELQDALDSVVERLSPDDRLLLKLRFEDDLPAQAIASVLRFPTAFHVYRRIKAVCGELRRSLAARGVEDPTP